MDPKTKEKLVKLLNLTMSENEGESLNAIRMANKILRKDKLMWDSVICAQGPAYGSDEHFSNFARDFHRRRSEPRFPFGKYKGEEISWVFENDYDYFMWVLRQPWLKPEFRKAMESFL